MLPTEQYLAYLLWKDGGRVTY